MWSAAGQDGRSSVAGVKVDRRRRLWAAGGYEGTLAVYDPPVGIVTSVSLIGGSKVKTGKPSVKTCVRTRTRPFAGRTARALPGKAAATAAPTPPRRTVRRLTRGASSLGTYRELSSGSARPASEPARTTRDAFQTVGTRARRCVRFEKAPRCATVVESRLWAQRGSR